jgi:hypothetical protein
MGVPYYKILGAAGASVGEASKRLEKQTFEPYIQKGHMEVAREHRRYGAATRVQKSSEACSRYHQP